MSSHFNAKPIFYFLDSPHRNVLVSGHFIAHEILKNNSNLMAQIFNRILTKIYSVQQHLTFGRIIQAAHQFDQSGFALPILPNQRDAFAGFNTQIEIVQNAAGCARIPEGNVLEFKALLNGPRRRKRVRFGHHRRLHIEERQKISQVKRLVRDAGQRGKYVLDITRYLKNRSC